MSSERTRKPVVAIDGPAGAGKSTVAREVARRQGLVYVDTGAMYRVVGFLAREAGLDLEDGGGLGALARGLKLRFVEGDSGQQVWEGDRDLTQLIRSPEIAQAASDVSRSLPVRQALGLIQRSLAQQGGVVMEGRDIGTVIAPDAEVKVFLTAEAQERARRRVQDLRARGRGQEPDEAAILAGIEARDAQDSSRDHAPLKAAVDAHRLDSSDKSFERVVEIIEGWVLQAGKERAQTLLEDAE